MNAPNTIQHCWVTLDQYVVLLFSGLKSWFHAVACIARDLSSHSTSYTLYSRSYWRVKFWNNSDSMHPSVLDNVIDILFCINVGFVVVSTLGKKKKRKPLRMTTIN